MIIFIKKIAQVTSGFSLVEILMVLGLFSSISTLSLGALFNAQAINGRLQETQAILDNVNLSFQTLVRDIRFGSQFYATTSAPSVATLPMVRKNCIYGGSVNCTVLVFTPSDSTLKRIVYYVNAGVLYKDEYNVSLVPTTLQLTARDIYVSSFMVYLDGAQTADGSNDSMSATDFTQPVITLFISGITIPAKTNIPSASFNIQTTISARGLDIQ